MQRRRLIKIFAIITIFLIVTGIIALYFFFNSRYFQQGIVKRFAAKIKARGLIIDGINVDPLGRVTIKNFKYRDPETGEEIVFGDLTGSMSFMAAATGRARVTIDATKLVRKMVARRYGGKVIMKPTGKVWLTIETNLREGLKRLEGNMRPDGVVLVMAPYPKLPLTFTGGTLEFNRAALTSKDGLAFDFAGVKFLFQGTIRDYFRKMEFIDAKLGAGLDMKSFATTVVDSFNIQEVSDKVSFLGELRLDSQISGTFHRPIIKGKFWAPKYRLNFHGVHRIIDNNPSNLRGEFRFGGSVSRPVFEIFFAMDKLHSEYWEKAHAYRKHLHFYADRVQGHLQYRDRIFDFKNMVFDCYGGRMWYSGTWDLQQSPVRLKGRLVAKEIDLGRVMKDTSAIGTFWDGKASGWLEGTSKTLKLEWIQAKGRFDFTDLALAGVPNAKELGKIIGDGNVRRLLGLRVPKTGMDFIIDHSFLDLAKIAVRTPEVAIKGSMRYNILSLKLDGSFETRLQEPFFKRQPAARSVFQQKGSTLQTGFAGRINEPLIQWRVSN